jgi:hypothetical protein
MCYFFAQYVLLFCNKYKKQAVAVASSDAANVTQVSIAQEKRAYTTTAGRG